MSWMEGNFLLLLFFIYLNFIIFILYIVNRKAFAINHGKTAKETFLADACKVAKGFMDRDPGELNFATIVLAPPQ